jgi:S1-C subfamily serine protease
LTPLDSKAARAHLRAQDLGEQHRIVLMLGDSFYKNRTAAIRAYGAAADRLPKQSVLCLVGNSDARIAVRVATGPNGPEVRPATVVSIDGAHDLALLKIAGTPLPALAISPSQDIREGQSIALMGFPIGGVLGFRPVTHRGIISAITPIALPMPASRQLNETTVQRLRSGTFDVYQLDATAYPGNSGGPVMDADTGEVVGVISMVLIKGTKESALTHPSGISYAMPASYVQELLKNR